MSYYHETKKGSLYRVHTLSHELNSMTFHDLSSQNSMTFEQSFYIVD